MPSYKVVHAAKKKDVDGQHGPMQVIALTLDDGSGAFSAEWFTKATTQIPGTGTSIEGTVEDSQYGKKFKRAQNGFGGGGGPRPEDPVRAAKIMRMHSQEMALRYINAKAAAGKLPEDFSMSDLRTIIDWFDGDAVSTTTQPQQQGAAA